MKLADFCVIFLVQEVCNKVNIEGFHILINVWERGIIFL